VQARDADFKKPFKPRLGFFDRVFFGVLGALLIVLSLIGLALSVVAVIAAIGY
jgi:hypothetical protein